MRQHHTLLLMAVDNNCNNPEVLFACCYHACAMWRTGCCCWHTGRTRPADGPAQLLVACLIKSTWIQEAARGYVHTTKSFLLGVEPIQTLRHAVASAELIKHLKAFAISPHCRCWQRCPGWHHCTLTYKQHLTEWLHTSEVWLASCLLCLSPTSVAAAVSVTDATCHVQNQWVYA
jgi:hypothetical protein